MGGEDVAGLAIVDIYQASRSTTAQSPNSYQVLFQGFFWETGCLHNWSRNSPPVLPGRV